MRLGQVMFGVLGGRGLWRGMRAVHEHPAMLPQVDHPIQLNDQSRLVLSPHSYGHNRPEYRDEKNWPLNMPRCRDAIPCCLARSGVRSAVLRGMR